MELIGIGNGINGIRGGGEGDPLATTTVAMQ